jgi:TonB family protein
MRGSRNENITTTNSVGAFTFSQLQPDTYRIEASLPGFQTQTLTFLLGAGGKFDGRLRLSLASLNTAIEVVSTRTSAIRGPEVTATGPIPTGPIRIGGDVAMANLIKQVSPVYPAASRAAGVQGVVLIEATIDTSGSVVNPRVMSRIDAALTEAALEAVKQWQYKPAFLNGQPTEVVTTITVNFSLTN